MLMTRNIADRVWLAVAGLLLLFLMPVPGPVKAERVTEMADCTPSPFRGSWVSTNDTVAFLSKLEILEECKQIVTRPVASNNAWAEALGQEKKYIYRGYTLRPSSTCYPVDCVWGRSLGKMAKNGVLKARFSLFLSQRILQLTLEKQVLRVKWRIKHTGKKKPDQLGETLFVRAK